jgi:hypothetical protein
MIIDPEDSGLLNSGETNEYADFFGKALELMFRDPNPVESQNSAKGMLAVLHFFEDTQGNITDVMAVRTRKPDF